MKNYKSTLYGAVVYCVIIGAIYVALSIVGLMTRWCVIESKGSPLAYMLYLIYFRVSSCEESIQWDLLNVNMNPTVIMPDETDAVNRTFIFLITYLGLHGALIAASLYGLCGVNNSCLGKRSFPIFFVPWIVILVAIVVLDVLATIYYVIDSISLTSSDGLINILEVVNVSETILAFEQISAHYRYLPPIIMLITSAKIFLLFIGNIVWIVAITKGGWTASTYHKYLDETRRNYENTMAGVNPAFEGLRDDIVAQKQHEKQMEYLSDQTSYQEINATSSTNQNPSAPPSDEPAETRYKDTTQIQQGVVYPYSINRNDKRTAPQPPQSTIEEEDTSGYKIKRPTTLVLPDRQPKPQQQTQYQHQQYQHQNSQLQNPQHQQFNSNSNYMDRDIDNRLSRYQETSGSAIKTIEPIKYDDIPEQQLSNNRVLVLPPISESNRSSLKPIPPPKPQYNRHSVQPSVRSESPVLYRPEAQRTNSARVDRTSSNLRAPDELRSQLPWSYFKPRNEGPKNAFDHLEENEDIPAVPVPDYTLHYGKKARTNLNNPDNDANYHQRY